MDHDLPTMTPRRGLLSIAAAGTAGLVAAASVTQRAHADPGTAAAAAAGLGTNVRDEPYQASGDGQHDDTAAIQSAIDDVLAAGGGTVVIPAGTYAVSAPITVASDTAGPLNLTLVGEGTASRIVRIDPDNKHTLLLFEGPGGVGRYISRCEVRQLGIGQPDGKSYPPDQWPDDGDPALVMRKLVEFNVEGCSVSQSGGTGIDLTDSYIGNFVGNWIRHNADAVVMHGVANAIRFIGNRIQANSGVGIRFPDSTPSPDYTGRAVTVYIAGNDIEGNGAQAIYFSDTRYDEITIISNHFEANWHDRFTSQSGPFIEKPATGTEFNGIAVIGNRLTEPEAIVFEEGENITLLANSPNGFRLGDAVKHWFAGPLPDRSLSMDDDILVNSATSGLVLTSPNGTTYRVTINDAGQLSAVGDWSLSELWELVDRLRTDEPSGGPLTQSLESAGTEFADLVLAIARGTATNLLTNPSFEDGSGTDVPGWTFWQNPDSHGDMHRSTAHAHSGGASIAVDGVTTGGPIQVHGVKADHLLATRAHILVPSDGDWSGEVQFHANLRDADGHTVRGLTGAKIPVAGHGGSWFTVDSIDRVPADAGIEQAQYVLRFWNLGDDPTVYVDDVAMFQAPGI